MARVRAILGLRTLVALTGMILLSVVVMDPRTSQWWVGAGVLFFLLAAAVSYLPWDFPMVR